MAVTLKNIYTNFIHIKAHFQKKLAKQDSTPKKGHRFKVKTNIIFMFNEKSIVAGNNSNMKDEHPFFPSHSSFLSILSTVTVAFTLSDIKFRFMAQGPN